MSRFYVACSSLTIAAILHFVAAPERFAHASFFIGTFYVFLGCFQIGLVIGYLLAKQSYLLRIMLYSSSGLLILFILNQALEGRLTFVVAEPYSPFVLIRKGCELLLVLCLLKPASLQNRR